MVLAKDLQAIFIKLFSIFITESSHFVKGIFGTSKQHRQPPYCCKTKTKIHLFKIIMVKFR